ncbi:DNA cytosine methyltransferase [Oricola sp.]|uniref:DNA cytosine methyltransferase n=1 Tax=Oricola sp. TaxID=1979950 RepID=UPI0025F19CC6|nr:DNA cytosine methyltransferase [Oricola sp.]MCI5074407.1 DNA cytosine methyltransferase [Oricola sp.]
MAHFISLFSGAGGLDLGLEMAGWQCRYASDIDPDAVATIEANRAAKLRCGAHLAFADAHVEKADVTKLHGADILASAGAKRGEIPLIAGGPPCQSWSSAGHQLGFDDPRGRLWSDFVRIAEEIDARWLVFENVRGLLTARGADGVPGSALATIRKNLLHAGFQTTVALLNAADFGVPQRRVRLFIVGYRAGDAPAFPSPTHTKNGDEAQGLSPWVSLGDCLSEIAPVSDQEIIRPTGKMALELAGIPPGSGVKSMGKVESTRPGGHWGYKQGAFVADPALPSRTVTASSQQDWLRDPMLGLRRLSPRECAALQTFPETFVWAARRSAQYRLIGNSVPPRLAAAIGSQLLGAVAGLERPVSEPHEGLSPLPPELQAAINYTAREERANGHSRRLAPSRRKRRAPVANV